MTEIWQDNGMIYAQVPFLQREKTEYIPGRKWNPKEKVWSFPRHGCLTVGLLDSVLEDADILDVDSRDDSYRYSNPVLAEFLQWKTTIEPWKHQRSAVEFTLQKWTEKIGVYLDFEMGTGKTKIAIDAIQSTMQASDDYGPALILCPKSVIPTWIKEIAKNTNDTVTFDLTDKDDYKGWMTGFSADFLICNHELAWREKINNSHLKDEGISFLIVDEAHRAKSDKGRFSKWLASFAKDVPYRLALSGTPIPRGLEDAFAQFRWLEPGLFGTKYSQFRKWFLDEDFTGHYPKFLGYRNVELYQKRSRISMLSCTREDAKLNLPDGAHTYRYCRLNSAEAEAYEAAREAFLLPDDSVRDHLTVLQTLRQITGGRCKVADGSVAELGTSKLDLLIDTIGDLPEDEPLVIWVQYQADIQAIVERIEGEFGEAAAVLSGQYNDLDDWQKEEFRFLICQAQSGGVGIDLTRASYAIYFGHDFRWADYSQSLARVHRPGQTRPVTWIHLIAEDTIDERIVEVLQNRGDFIAELLERKVQI